MQLMSKVYGSRALLGSLALSISFLALFNSSVVHAENAPTESPNPSQSPIPHDPVSETIHKFILDPDVSASASIFDLGGIFEGVDAGLSYGVGLQRVGEKRVLKIDAWKPKASLTPTSWGNFGPLFLNISMEDDIIFVRHFPDMKSAMASKALVPYFNAGKIPISAKNIDNLEPGEMVVVPMQMSAQVGLGAYATNGVLMPYAQVGYLMSGLYQVQVLKLKDNKVRMRIISRNAKGKGGEFGVRVDLIAGTQIDNWIDGKYGFRLNWYKDRKGTMLMSDYLFDMNDPKARAAIDSIVKPMKRVKDQFRILNITKNSKGLTESFFADVSPADELAKEDMDKPIDQRRVTHLFFLRDDFKNQGYRMDVGLSPANERIQMDRSRNSVKFSDTSGVEVQYDIPSYDKVKRVNVLFGYRKSESDNFAACIADTSVNSKSFELCDYFVRVDGKNNVVDGYERNRILHHFRRNVMELVRSYLGVEQYLQQPEYHDLQFMARVVINKKTLEKLQDTPKATLQEKFKEYLDEINRTGDLPSRAEFGFNPVSAVYNGVRGTANYLLVPLFNRNADLGQWNWWLQARRLDIGNCVESLYQILSSKSGLTNENRRRMFIDLHQNSAWSELGTGYLMSMIPKDELKSSVHVSVGVFAKELGAEHPKGIVSAFPLQKYTDGGTLPGVVEYLNVITGVGALDLRGTTFGNLSTPSGQIVSLANVIASHDAGMVSFKDTEK